MDFVANYFLQQMHFDKESLDNILTLELQARNQMIVDSYITKELIFNTDKEGNVNISNLMKNLEDENITDTDIESIDDCLAYTNNNFEEMINQTTSYLIALDLFNLFLKDPEKAVYDLTVFPTLSGNNPLEELSHLDITFFNDKYKNLNAINKKLLLKQ